MRRRVLVSVGVVLLVAVGVVAYVSLRGVEGPPDREPDVRGVIVSIANRSDARQGFRVVWTDDPAVGEQAAFDAAEITMTEDGVIEGEVSVGAIAEVWITGPVLESYPVQAGAEYVRITGEYDGELPTPPGLEP